MENASQALIIAGAILLAILIIALGMYVFTSASTRIRSGADKLDEHQVNSLNSEYKNYMRGTIRGSEVQQFLSNVRTKVLNNDAPAEYGLGITAKIGSKDLTVNRPKSNDDEDGEGGVKKTYATEITALENQIKSNATYKIHSPNVDGRGLIVEVKIDEVASSGILQ